MACGTTALWAALACAVAGPTVGNGEERRYNVNVCYNDVIICKQLK